MRHNPVQRIEHNRLGLCRARITREMDRNEVLVVMPRSVKKAGVTFSTLPRDAGVASGQIEHRQAHFPSIPALDEDAAHPQSRIVRAPAVSFDRAGGGDPHRDTAG